LASVLCVDDEPAFLEIAQQYLSKLGHHEIDTSISARDALARTAVRKYDVIVSDYQMPDIDGLELLKAIREKGDSTPFIVFTGKGREDVVIDALNLGADFYLQKGGDTRSLFAELENMIERLVEHSNARRSLADSEEKYKVIFENTGSAMITTDLEGKVILANREFEMLTGHDREDIEGRPWNTFVDEESAGQVPSILKALNEYPSSAQRSFEIWLKKTDGSRRRVITRPRLVSSRNMLIAPFIDVSHLRETEMKLRRLNRMHSFLSHVNQANIRCRSSSELLPELCRVAVKHGGFEMAWVGVLDPTTQSLVPEAWAPQDTEDIHNPRTRLADLSKDTEASMRAVKENHIILEGTENHEGTMSRIPKRVRSLQYKSLASIPLRRENKAIGSLNMYSTHPDHFGEGAMNLMEDVVADIEFSLNSYDHEGKLRSRTRELAQKVNELRFMNTITNLAQDEGTTFEEYCGQAIRILEAVLERYGDPSVRIRIDDDVRTSADFKERSHRISTPIRESGTVVGHLEVFYEPAHVGPGADSGVGDEKHLIEHVASRIGIALRLEKTRSELARQSALSQKYLEVANVMIVVIDARGIVSLVNKKACSVLGYEEHEVVGKNWFDSFLPPGSRERVQDIFSEIIGGDLSRFEHAVNEVVTKTGELKSISWHNTFVCDESGKVISTVSSGQVVDDETRA
jgi:PAS domain S-box-containing protein